MKGLTDKGADRMMFEVEGKGEESVAGYFEGRYKMKYASEFPSLLPAHSFWLNLVQKFRKLDVSNRFSGIKPFQLLATPST